MTNYNFYITLALTILITVCQQSIAQTEFEPWGNIKGIRLDGQLMKFQSNISVVRKNWSEVVATGKEKQRPNYIRKGKQQIVTTNIDSLYFTKTVEDAGKGKANVNVQVTSKSDEVLEGVYVNLTIPATYYARKTFQLNNLKAVKIATSSDIDKYLETPARSIQFSSAKGQFKITFPEPTLVIRKTIINTTNGELQLFVPVKTGSIQNAQTFAKNFSIAVSGLVDRKPVSLTLNTSNAGRVFDGFGGNFRLQNLQTDPQVIDYCLKNLRVAWGRAEMPWRLWQPAIDTNPIAAAQAGKLNPHVQRSMEMAQRLYKMGMPVILSAWSGPDWAIVGKAKFRPGPDSIWGNPLDHSKDQDIYKSIADYIVYMKDQYGVEVSMFSFNESDLGINIRQTGQEHAELIKGLGNYFASRGLKTKLLLGDNSDATTYEFVYPALSDPAAHPYIGAVSFHSWRGWETETLQKWAEVATKLRLPLIIGEGSIDAQAWGYPAIFEEQMYALEEINLYTRLLAICQPASILQWQLTADYSPLVGGGIFGDTTPLRPTQRFCNLKQLASTPAGLKAMPVSVLGTDVSAAALGDNDKGVYAVHLVNNGSARPVNLTGLPATVKSLRMLVTDKQRAMKEAAAIPVTNGTAKFTMDATSYITLVSK